MAPAALTWAAVLGPGPGSRTEGLGDLLAFLRAGFASAASQTPNVSGGPHGHALMAVSIPHHSAVLAALPHVLGVAAPSGWPAELPTGFHRLRLGHCVLTLCVGPVLPSVTQWHCHAQHFWVGGDWFTEPVATLARPLARQAAMAASLTLALPPGAGADSAWQQAGFQPTGQVDRWQYRPRWPVAVPPPAPTRTALVIGAGLAGAAVCASLTRRGWHITLLDGAEGPARGASGLPVGLLSEHVTAGETVLSRLSRSGMALHARELAQLVPEGQGWQTTQVTNLRQAIEARADADHGTEAHPPESSQPALTVRPAALVQAWLALAQSTGHLHTRWRSPVVRLERKDTTGPWQALATNGEVLAHATHAVVAAAYGSAALLPDGQALRPVKGQLSFATLDGPPLAPHPLRDHGVYVPSFEDSAHPSGRRLWAMGSTYERGQQDSTVTADGHDRNADSLATTLPAAHELFVHQRAQGELQGWANVRCASLDRLPLVGAVPVSTPLQPHLKLGEVPREAGLWALCALGSRGLTLSMLGAELLAAQMEHEPWPVERDLVQALDPARFALKQARKSRGTAACESGEKNQ